VPAAAALLLLGCAGGPRIQTTVPLEELERTAVADSADGVAHYNVALAYWGADRFDEARAALERATARSPRLAQAHLALAYLPYAERPELWREVEEDRVPAEWQDALIASDQHYRHAFMIDPLVDMRILGAVEPPSSAMWTVSDYYRSMYDAWFRGFDDYREGNYGAAFGRFDRLIYDLEQNWRRDARQRMPDAILLHRGLAAAHLERWDVAEGDLRILFDRQRDVEEDEERLIHVPLETNHYRYILAVLLSKTGDGGDRVEAEALLRDAAQENLGLYMAHVRLAELAEARRDWSTALAERQRAIDANPTDHTLHVELGATLATVGRFEQALAAIRQGIELSPLDPQAHYLLGMVAEAAGDADTAIAAYERTLAVAPSRLFTLRQDATERLDALR